MSSSLVRENQRNRVFFNTASPYRGGGNTFPFPLNQLNGLLLADSPVPLAPPQTAPADGHVYARDVARDALPEMYGDPPPGRQSPPRRREALMRVFVRKPSGTSSNAAAAGLIGVGRHAVGSCSHREQKRRVV